MTTATIITRVRVASVAPFAITTSVPEAEATTGRRASYQHLVSSSIKRQWSSSSSMSPSSSPSSWPSLLTPYPTPSSMISTPRRFHSTRLITLPHLLILLLISLLTFTLLPLPLATSAQSLDTISIRFLEFNRTFNSTLLDEAGQDTFWLNLTTHPSPPGTLTMNVTRTHATSSYFIRLTDIHNTSNEYLSTTVTNPIYQLQLDQTIVDLQAGYWNISVSMCIEGNEKVNKTWWIRTRMLAGETIPNTNFLGGDDSIMIQQVEMLQYPLAVYAYGSTGTPYPTTAPLPSTDQPVITWTAPPNTSTTPTPPVFVVYAVSGALVFTYRVSTIVRSTSATAAANGIALYNSTYKNVSFASDALNTMWTSNIWTRFTMFVVSPANYQPYFNLSLFVFNVLADGGVGGGGGDVFNSPDVVIQVMLPYRLISWTMSFDNSSYLPGDTCTSAFPFYFCSLCCLNGTLFDTPKGEPIGSLETQGIFWQLRWESNLNLQIGTWFQPMLGGGYGNVTVQTTTRSLGTRDIPIQYNNLSARYWIDFPKDDYYFHVQVITQAKQVLNIILDRSSPPQKNRTVVEKEFAEDKNTLVEASRNLTGTTSPLVVVADTDLKWLGLQRFDASSAGGGGAGGSSGGLTIQMQPNPVSEPTQNVTVTIKPTSTPPSTAVSHDAHLIVLTPNPFVWNGVVNTPDVKVGRDEFPYMSERASSVTLELTDTNGVSLQTDELTPLPSYQYSIVQTYDNQCTPPDCTPFCQLYNRTSNEWRSLDLVQEIDVSNQQIRCSTSIPGTVGVFMKRIITRNDPIPDVTDVELHYGQPKNDLALVIALLVVAGLLFIIMFIGGFFAFLRETRQMKAQIDALKRSMKESQLESLNDDNDDNMEMGADTEYYLAHSNRNSSSNGGGGGAPLIGGSDGDVTNGDSLDYGGDVTGVGSGHIIHDGAVPLESPSLYIDSPSIMYTQHRTSTALWNYSPANSPLATATTPGPSRPLTATSPMPLLASAYSSRRPLPMTTTRAVFISPPSPRISHLPKSMQPLTDEELAWHIRHS